MSAILHDSQDWRELQAKLTSILLEQSSLRAELKAAKETQEQHHSVNQDWIRKVEEKTHKLDLLIEGDGSDDFPGLKTQMAVMISYGKATVTGMKLLGAVLTIILLAATFYVAWFESHHKVAQNVPTQTSEQNVYIYPTGP